MITPATMGFIPTPVISFRLVLRPMAARAIAKKNFDKNEICETITSVTNPVLLTATTARKPRLSFTNTLFLCFFHNIIVSFKNIKINYLK